MSEITNEQKNKLSVVSLNKEDVLTGCNVSSRELSAMIRDLDTGNYDSAVKIQRILLQDSCLKQPLDSRLYNLFDTKFICVSNRKADKKDCDKINKVLAEYEQDLKKAYADFIMLGYGLAQMVWEQKEDNNYLPKFYYYEPYGLRYDNVADINFLITTNQDITEDQKESRLKQLEKSNGFSFSLYSQNLNVEKLNDNIKWLSLEYGHQGYRSGQIRSLCWEYLDKQNAKDEYDNWCSKQAGIIYKLLIPNTTDQSKTKTLASAVKHIKKNSVVALPQGNDKESSYDLTTIEPSNQNVYQAFNDRISKVDANYRLALLCNNLTTEVTSGSLAASSTHREKELYIAKSDKQFLTAQLNNQFISAWKQINNPSFQGEITLAENKTEDIQQKLDIVSNITLISQACRDNGLKLNLQKLIGELEIDFIDVDDNGENNAI